MANSEHLEILRQGVEVWNQWREENVEVKPNLSYANLSGVNLSYADLRVADLSKADLSGVNLSEADLRVADLSGVNLSKANLSGVNLSGADLSGVNLSGADLSGVNLSKADLSKADLSKADLSGANFSETDLSKADLSGANFSETDLSKADLTVANLSKANLSGVNLSEADLSGANLSKANLSGINLSEADLREANLSEVNLSEANLSGFDLSGTSFRRANLSGVNLKRSQSLETNFEGATLTGACIEDWNINTKTNLDNIKCDYIFLRTENENFSERRPHQEDKVFEPGDFERLVRKAQETVDLIFRHGIDWQGFLNAYEELKVEAGGDIFPIQAIENKGDGSFVVRIQAPPELDKAAIQKSFETKYKRALKIREKQYREKLKIQDRELKNYRDKIEIYRQHNTNLLEIVKLKASQPLNINLQQGDSIMSGNYYEQSGNLGIGHQSDSEIKGNAKFGGVFNEAEQKHLAEAAAEIQQLLEQLDKSYPSDTTQGKMQIATEAMSQIENNPQFTARILSALKAGGVSAFEQFLNHPAASFIIGALEDFQKTKGN